jgi:hypothetical protein
MGADAGSAIFEQLAARFPKTINISCLWINALSPVSGERIDVEALVGTGATVRIDGRFRFVCDIATGLIENR